MLVSHGRSLLTSYYALERLDSGFSRLYYDVVIWKTRRTGYASASLSYPRQGQRECIPTSEISI